MIASALVAFIVRQEPVSFRFHPNVGEKYRYSMTVENEAGAAQIPKGQKRFQIYKIAGFKDGKYTVHQMIEKIESDGKSDSRLQHSYYIDEFLNLEEVNGVNSYEANGQAMFASVNGCFGFIYSKDPLKLNTESKTQIDIDSLAKKYFPPVPDSGPQPKLTGKGDRSLVIENIDEKTGTLRSQIVMGLNISFSDGVQSFSSSMSQNTLAIASIEMETGMPIKLDRTISFEMNDGRDKQTIYSKVHLLRVP